MSDFDFDRFKVELFEGLSAAADSVSTAAQDMTSDVKRYKRFAETGRDLFLSGLITSHGGNMSETDGTSIWITRTGAMLGRVTPGNIVETAWGADASGRDAEASMELVVHRAIYQALAASENGDLAKSFKVADTAGEMRAAIIHAHPAHTVARSLVDAEICPPDSEGKLLLGESVSVIAPKEAVASVEAAEKMAELVSMGACIAVVAGHGPFAVASSLEEAYKLISCLERSAEIVSILT
ncbi:MAG: class II aldolase/adducin family protein [Coriobacteriia bacterium]|nr:class II aldolase/adducin family protein [Coriobacteriia bacterium]